MTLARALLAFLALALALAADRDAAAQGQKRYTIYAITFRGMTEVERGFQEYFLSRRLPVDIVWRDLARDASRMPGFIEEIRRTRPDLVYTWGTSVTLGAVGPYDKVDPSRHITDIPVVFTMVAAPVLAKIVPDLKSSRRNLTGVYIVASTEAQLKAMSSYRPLKTIGMIYTPTEQNSVVVLDELRALSRQMGFSLIARPFNVDPVSKKVTNEGAADMVREMKEQGASWLYLPPDSYLNTQTEKLIIPAAMENNLPTFASTEGLMATGALIGLVARYHSIGQFTAYKAEQILVRKRRPENIPIETLTRFSLQVRMDVADQLKLPPPLPMFNYAELIVPRPLPRAETAPATQAAPAERAAAAATK